MNKKQISQYGITWKFDKAYPCGHFVNGDWWVVGPVTIVSVTPPPGPPRGKEKYKVEANQFGDVSLQADDRMRNGSMVVLAAGDGQGYDSRKLNYQEDLSVSFPFNLDCNRSLISTISHDSIPNPNFLKGHFEKTNQLLKTAAVLTCLAAVPPDDAFRPAYAGTTKTIYRAADLKPELLPALKPLADTPDPDQIIPYFKRVWLDHSRSWLRVTPQENCPDYGREFSRITGFGACLLLLDIPTRQKQKLLIGLVQLGIDLYGLSQNGMHWPADGGHWAGRKLPILLTGLLLDQPQMLSLPPDLYFHEDQQTYYGHSFTGRTVLWQMVTHHGPRQPYEEKDPKDYDAMDRRSEGYRHCCNGHSWIGMALAARWLKLVKAWNHDAFFDYCDRWMEEKPAATGRRRRGGWTAQATDPWVTSLWQAYRAGAPQQPGATENLKWVWDENGRGSWVPNPKPQ